SPLPMTLRVAVAGTPQRGPGYAGDAAAAGFALTDDDRAAAKEGRVDDDDRHETLFTVVAVSGIGMGSALLLGLALWTLLTRRPPGRHASS
ncbi:hypothetical protein ACWF94_18900, partial [Streptomyces sp. NPDC055078]